MSALRDQLIRELQLRRYSQSIQRLCNFIGGVAPDAVQRPDPVHACRRPELHHG
jgi:hypothetical protein